MNEYKLLGLHYTITAGFRNECPQAKLAPGKGMVGDDGGKQAGAWSRPLCVTVEQLGLLWWARLAGLQRLGYGPTGVLLHRWFLGFGTLNAGKMGDGGGGGKAACCCFLNPVCL